MLRSIDYTGPVSVEWEDAGIDRSGRTRGPDPSQGVRLRAAVGILRRGVRQQRLTSPVSPG